MTVVGEGCARLPSRDWTFWEFRRDWEEWCDWRAGIDWCVWTIRICQEANELCRHDASASFMPGRQASDWSSRTRPLAGAAGRQSRKG